MIRHKRKQLQSKEQDISRSERRRAGGTVDAAGQNDPQIGPSSGFANGLDDGANRDRPRFETAKERKPAERNRASTHRASFEYLRKVAGDFNEVVDQCAADAEVKSVHQLRTGSRRIQALVETILREAGVSGRLFQKSAKGWLRPMKALRRAAGPVRDLDVHRKLLEESLGGSSGKAKDLPSQAVTVGQDRTPPANGADDASLPAAKAGTRDEVRSEAGAMSGQALKLENWLKDKRHARAEALRKQIRKRREDLSDGQTEFFASLEGGYKLSTRARPATVVALDAFVRAVDAFPSLDSANLHDFRKQAKRARYIAESGGEAEAQKVGEAIKRVQDAIGDWHDWQCLAEESKTALGAEGAELRTWIEGRAKRSLTQALATTERMRGRLVGEWRAAKGKKNNARPRPSGGAATPRKAPQAVPGAHSKRAING